MVTELISGTGRVRTLTVAIRNPGSILAIKPVRVGLGYTVHQRLPRP